MINSFDVVVEGAKRAKLAEQSITQDLQELLHLKELNLCGEAEDAALEFARIRRAEKEAEQKRGKVP